MRIINIPQDTNEWLEFRKNGIGASDMAAILGVSPYKSPYTLWLDKTRRTGSETQNRSMYIGKEYQQAALDWLNKKKGAKFEPIVCLHDAYDFIYASIDAYSADLGMIVEIKVPYKDFARMPYPHEIIQVQYQSAIMQPDKAYILIYDRLHDEGMLHFVDRNPEIEELHINKAKEFWENHVMLDDPPAKKSTDKEIIEDPDLLSLLADYQKITDEETTLSQRKKEIREQILSRCNGNNSYRTPTHQIILQQGKKSYNYKKMIEDGIDLNPYTKVSDPTYVIRKIEVK